MSFRVVHTPISVGNQFLIYPTVCAYISKYEHLFSDHSNMKDKCHTDCSKIVTQTLIFQIWIWIVSSVWSSHLFSRFHVRLTYFRIEVASQHPLSILKIIEITVNRWWFFFNHTLFSSCSIWELSFAVFTFFIWWKNMKVKILPICLGLACEEINSWEIGLWHLFPVLLILLKLFNPDL